MPTATVPSSGFPEPCPSGPSCRADCRPFPRSRHNGRASRPRGRERPTEGAFGAKCPNSTGAIAVGRPQYPQAGVDDQVRPVDGFGRQVKTRSRCLPPPPMLGPAGRLTVDAGHRVRPPGRQRRRHRRGARRRPPDRKATILRVAAELFASRGYAAVSLTEIAEGVGISPGAMYRHYPGKEGVLDAVMLDTVEGYASVVRRALRGGRRAWRAAGHRPPAGGGRFDAGRTGASRAPRDVPARAQSDRTRCAH